MQSYRSASISPFHQGLKRAIDVVVASIGLLLVCPLILLAFLVASVETKQWGFFRQRRVGLHGRPFDVLKIRTMRSIKGITTTATTVRDPRITRWGMFFRRTKIDELPQLWNVLLGEMSLVGPRPDVPELIETLSDDVRSVILSVRPGMTGPATVRFRNEEVLLAQQVDPERYNREVLFPWKAQLNCQHIQHYRLRNELACLLETVLPFRRPGPPPDEGSPHHPRRAA